jgi:hypothetical protein
MKDDSMLGMLFAFAEATEQAEFLNAVGRNARRTWTPGAMGYDMQLCRIADALDSDGKTFVRRLGEFVVSDNKG